MAKLLVGEFAFVRGRLFRADNRAAEVVLLCLSKKDKKFYQDGHFILKRAFLVWQMK